MDIISAIPRSLQAVRASFLTWGHRDAFTLWPHSKPHRCPYMIIRVCVGWATPRRYDFTLVDITTVTTLVPTLISISTRKGYTGYRATCPPLMCVCEQVLCATGPAATSGTRGWAGRGGRRLTRARRRGRTGGKRAAVIAQIATSVGCPVMPGQAPKSEYKHRRTGHEPRTYRLSRLGIFS